jgi:large conductance mechanosensitive channel
VVYGSTITALINFLIVAAVVYFVVVVPMQAITQRTARDADADTPAPSDEAKLLTEIRDLLHTQRRA